MKSQLKWIQLFFKQYLILHHRCVPPKNACNRVCEHTLFKCPKEACSSRDPHVRGTDASPSSWP